MQPWFKTSEVGLRIKNDRYQRMIDYFDNLSPFGRRMMLESSSLQISLDLGKTTGQAVKRIKLANFLVPFTTALFANSPNDSQTRTSYKTYRHHVWQNLDPLRSGTSYARNFKRETTYSEIVGAYLEFVLKAPVIRPADATGLPNRPVTFEEWLKKGIDQSFPDLADLKNHLSFLFPDVRIRSSLEIRSIDVTPEGWEFVPICFYCGILYDDQALDQALEILYAQRDSIEGLLKQCVYGLQSDSLFETGRELFRIAIEGYGRLPEQFKLKEAPEDRFEEYFREATLKRKTFADMQTDLFAQLLG
jgi:glutamate--cysteine ligase